MQARRVQHRPWLESITRHAGQQQVTETPTVLINGVRKPQAGGWSIQPVESAVSAPR